MNNLWIKILPFSALACLSFSCSDSPPEDPEPILVESEQIVTDDAEINAAMEKARATFNDFVTAADPASDSSGSGYLAQVLMTEGDLKEQVWISNVQKEADGAYTGSVNDTPTTLTKVELLQEVKFTLEQVSDWQFLSNDKVIGAHVIRVKRSRMSEAEREENDAMYPIPNPFGE